MAICLMVTLGLCTACGVSSTMVAKVGDRTITQSDVEEADRFYRFAFPTQDAEGEEARKQKVLELLAYDALIAEDTADYDPTSDVVAMWNSYEEKLGGREGLLAQLKGYGLDESSFRALLACEARAREHRRRFDAAQATAKETLQQFFSAHRDVCVLISFTEYVVPTRDEAKEIKRRLEESEEAKKELENVYNTDVFDSTYVKRYDEVGKEDEAVFDADLLTQESGSVEIYAAGDLFHVVVLEKQEADFSVLQERIREQYLTNAYKKEIDRKAREAQLQLFPENLSFRGESVKKSEEP
uniref:hypothetical protein n=1 Tax=Ndongobacter massiliensis TaxID=1871025 RepID=UPI0012FEB2E8|nr:hypothetical protein [Ndongobacter massiliensis]